MSEVQLNKRGQITIPKKIREQVGLKPKDRIEIQINNEGQLVLEKKDLLDEIQDLIRKDLYNKGYSEAEIEKKLPVIKMKLGTALTKIAGEAQEQIEQGEFSTLDELEAELDNDE